MTAYNGLNRQLFTIGYQGKTAEAVIQKLIDSRVGHLVDVRYRPLSRKKGLSKRALSTACSDVGIEYHHDAGLGTPPEIMKGLRETGVYDWPRYRTFLQSQQESLERVTNLAAENSICLMCYEAAADECHRSVVAEAIADRLPVATIHLR